LAQPCCGEKRFGSELVKSSTEPRLTPQVLRHCRLDPPPIDLSGLSEMEENLRGKTGKTIKAGPTKSHLARPNRASSTINGYVSNPIFKKRKNTLAHGFSSKTIYNMYTNI